MIGSPASQGGATAARGQVLGVVTIFGLVAVLLGLAGGLLDWVGQVLVISLILPIAVIALDYRHGIVLALLLMPYVNSPLVPQAGVLSLGNVGMLGIVLVFSLRWVLFRIQGRSLDVPLDREMVWLYLLPITVAACIGSIHLGEIPRYFLLKNHLAEYGLKTYWVSLYFKQMLLVAVALVAGVAVTEHGHARRFVVAMVMSGLLFVAAIVTLIAISGIPLSDVMRLRESLHLIGRHNNEAGVMLLGVLGPVLFMREMSTKAWLRFWLLIALGILVAGILLTGSRGAFLGMLVMSVWYLWRFRRVGTILLALTLALTGLALTPDAVRDRLMTGLDSSRSAGVEALGRGDDELTAGRVWIYEQMIPDVLSSPLVGRGLTSTQWSTPVKNGIYSANHPHNLYIEVLLDVGLIGLACMFLFCRFVWRRFMALGGDERLAPEMRGFFLGSGAGLLGMLAYGVSNGHYYPAPEQLYFWMSFGLAAGFARRLRSAPDLPQAAVPSARQDRWRRPVRDMAPRSSR